MQTPVPSKSVYPRDASTLSVLLGGATDIAKTATYGVLGYQGVKAMQAVATKPPTVPRSRITVHRPAGGRPAGRRRRNKAIGIRRLRAGRSIPSTDIRRIRRISPMPLPPVLRRRRAQARRANAMTDDERYDR